LFYGLSSAISPIATPVFDAMRRSPDMTVIALPLLGTAFFGMMLSIARGGFENRRDRPPIRVRLGVT
jgi:hypothetical protein